MNAARILVFGYSDLGHACLKSLLDREENVVAVYTHKDRPGENLWFPSVMKLAEERGVPVRTEENLEGKEELAHIRSLRPDLIFSFYYRNLIPATVLEMPRLGAYNMHGSYLPKYRGRAPVNWAVLNGETKTGATLHVMVEKADAGDIIDQEPVAIGPDDTAAIVQMRVTQAAVKILGRQIDNLKAGTAPRIPQDPTQASYFGKRRPEDGEIDWNRPAAQIHNLIRAVAHPYPGAYTDVFGRKTFIWESRLSSHTATAERPGEFQIIDGNLIVFAGDGRGLRIERIQLDGDEEMAGPDFIVDLMTNRQEVMS